MQTEQKGNNEVSESGLGKNAGNTGSSRSSDFLGHPKVLGSYALERGKPGVLKTKISS